ncbi:hypothetical protein [Luteitalea sp.]|jgi:hypothetical protein|uniref:hypothetical protein n=1 Tax=Luteitalea sp. TaxID=2004800 RepID=UPI0037CB2781
MVPATEDGGILAYDASLHAEALAFQPQAYPRRRRAWLASRWDWMFLGSASRLHERPAVWFHRTDAGMFGQRGAMLVRLRCGHDSLIAGWLVDTVVLPDVRGRGVGGALVARATRDLPVGLSLGQTGQIRTLQDRCGWQPVASMRSWSLVIDPQTAFRGRLRQEVVRAGVAWGASLWTHVCGLWARPASAFTSCPVDRFGPAHDALWSAVEAQHACAVVRDASYLNWKYVEQPGVEPRRLEIVDARGDVRGVCVWTRLPPERSHAYARGWILDMVVPWSDPGAVRALLAAVIGDARAQSVAVLEFDVLSPPLERVLLRSGWLRGGLTRHLRVSAPGVAADVRARLLSTDGWFLTRGDSDGDHPWATEAGREPEAAPA